MHIETKKIITQKHALSNNEKKSKATTKPWFSRLLRHPARKWSGSILGHKTHTYIYSLTCRKNSNIIRTIFTKNRGLVAEVRIIHVNWKNAYFLVGFSHKTVITLHYTCRPTRHLLGKRCRTAMAVSRLVIWVDEPPSLVVLKPRSHCVRRRKLTHSASRLVDV